MSETTTTSTSPPPPGPAVELAICAPPLTVRLPAVTVTGPPIPDCEPVAEAAIWVGAMPIPSSTSAPGVVTVTAPPDPVPAVVLAISAPDPIVICGAVTATDPALPVVPGWVSVAIRAPDPPIDKRPTTLTATLPALPVLAGKLEDGPNALLEISPPLTIKRAPASTVTTPALPVLPALEFATTPVCRMAPAAIPLIVS